MPKGIYPRSAKWRLTRLSGTCSFFIRGIEQSLYLGEAPAESIHLWQTEVLPAVERFYASLPYSKGKVK